MKRADFITASVFAVVVGLTASIGDAFWLELLAKATILSIVYLSVGVIYDNAGLLSLCQMSFAGIGAWTMGTLAERWDLPYLIMLVFAGVVPMLVGALIGVPALRLRGQNLAVFTLVFSAAVSTVVFRDGFPGLLTGNRVERPSFASGDAGFYVLSAVILGLTGAVVTAMRRARVGRSWWSVRRSERATASLGRSVMFTKLTAFATSAAIAGIGGGLLVADTGTVSASSFEPFDSMTVLTTGLMFGSGHFEGALFAGLFGELIPTVLRNNGLSPDIAAMIFAVGGILSLSQGEGGLAGALRGSIARFRNGRNAVSLEQHEVSDPVAAIAGLEPVVHDGPVLSIEDVSVSYGAIQALSHVSFDVSGGSLVGLIGPNGAGKSTLVDLIAGMIPQHDGRIVLLSQDVTGMKPQLRARAGLRRSFQQGHTPRDLTVGGYLDLAAPNAACSVDDALELFSLPAADTPIALLDVGARRILEVCGAVRGQPAIVLLDEPAAGLSGTVRERFVQAISRIPDVFGTAVLLIEHDLEVVVDLCEVVHVLDFGKLIAMGAPDQVLTNPDVVAAYLGAPA